MRAARDLWSDLVERRLWPIPLLLLAALVAVPLLLSKPAPESDDASDPTGPAATASSAGAGASAPAGPVVSVAEQGEVTAVPLRGHAKNPFRQQHVPQRRADETAAAATTDTPASATPSGGGTGGGDTGSGSGSTGGAGTQQPQKTYQSVSIDVRFGPAAGDLRAIDDVARLRPLPSAAHPVVIFLGMRRDHATAVFLVSTDVHVQGVDTCVPSPGVCQSIELKEGDVALLDYRAADGTTKQYELDLDKVTVHETTSKAEAESSYARVSRAGARLLRRRVRASALGSGGLHPPLRIPFRYAPHRGELHIAPYRSRAHRANARGALADLRATARP